MDWDAGLAGFAAHALCLQAGAIVALAIALAAAAARARGQANARAGRISAENDGLRDELWRLKEAAGARDRAEAASEAKSRFLTTMSHEIRTPISGILGMADLLREASLDPENASYVEAIRSSGCALIALIDEILDLAKIEAGRFDLVVEMVDLRRLTEGVVELLAPRAQSKGIEIAASFSATAPRFVRADGLRLRQVLTNLAGNAVKFTDQGGVCVTVERGENGAAQFSVVDTGPGVPVERRTAIFDNFEQGDGSHARSRASLSASWAGSLRLPIIRGAGRSSLSRSNCRNAMRWRHSTIWRRSVAFLLERALSSSPTHRSRRRP
jgi:signal transduction histidine kinase